MPCVTSTAANATCYCKHASQRFVEARTLVSSRVLSGCDPCLGIALQAVSGPLETFKMCQQYLDLVAAHPTHMRMVKGHVHKLLQGWLAEFTDIRDRLNREAASLGVSGLQRLVSPQDLYGKWASTGCFHQSVETDGSRWSGCWFNQNKFSTLFRLP